MPGLDTVEVCIDLERFDHPVLMGRLHHQQSGAGEIFSFEYDRAWLEQPEVFSCDPDLALAAGHQYPVAQRKNFGIFLDSARIAGAECLCSVVKTCARVKKNANLAP